jgi:hypothetical protein
MKGIYKIVTIGIFGFIALGIAALIILPSPWDTQNSVIQQPRIVVPRMMDAPWVEEEYSLIEVIAREVMTPRIPLGEGNVVVSVLNGNFYRNPVQEQFVAYHNIMEPGGPVYLTFIEYDAASRTYRRTWTAATSATRPETVTLDVHDLIGDWSVSVLLSGMNHYGEYTLTVFRMNPSYSSGQEGAGHSGERFSQIADIRVDGNILVREVARPQSYQMGIVPGQSFTIAARGRDIDSANIMDQIEAVYAFNPPSGFFERRSSVRIPGAHVEQLRVREILSNSGAFEEFLSGLWFYVTAQGTIDRNQYIYFDPANRQVIFFSDDTMQVFAWRNSIATRNGIHIVSQNISISTIRRAIDVQLESLEGIRIRTSENLRPAFRMLTSPQDGSYRRAGRPAADAPPAAMQAVHLEARYDSPMGRLYFFSDGSYHLHASNGLSQGKYAFFSVNGKELLELRSNGSSGPQRQTFIVEGELASGGVAANQQSLTLLPVRFSSRGIERLQESPLSLTLVDGS